MSPDDHSLGGFLACCMLGMEMNPTRWDGGDVISTTRDPKKAMSCESTYGNHKLYPYVRTGTSVGALGTYFKQYLSFYVSHVRTSAISA